MAFLKDRCARYPLTPEIVSSCAPFSCGDKDLDENIETDAALQTRLMFFDLMQIVEPLKDAHPTTEAVR